MSVERAGLGADLDVRRRSSSVPWPPCAQRAAQRLAPRRGVGHPQQSHDALGADAVRVGQARSVVRLDADAVGPGERLDRPRAPGDRARRADARAPRNLPNTSARKLLETTFMRRMIETNGSLCRSWPGPRGSRAVRPCRACRVTSTPRCCSCFVSAAAARRSGSLDVATARPAVVAVRERRRQRDVVPREVVASTRARTSRGRTGRWTPITRPRTRSTPRSRRPAASAAMSLPVDLGIAVAHDPQVAASTPSARDRPSSPSTRVGIVDVGRHLVEQRHRQQQLLVGRGGSPHPVLVAVEDRRPRSRSSTETGVRAHHVVDALHPLGRSRRGVGGAGGDHDRVVATQRRGGWGARRRKDPMLRLAACPGPAHRPRLASRRARSSRACELVARQRLGEEEPLPHVAVQLEQACSWSARSMPSATGLAGSGCRRARSRLRSGPRPRRLRSRRPRTTCRP